MKRAWAHFPLLLRQRSCPARVFRTLGASNSQGGCSEQITVAHTARSACPNTYPVWFLCSGASLQTTQTNTVMSYSRLSLHLHRHTLPVNGARADRPLQYILGLIGPFAECDKRPAPVSGRDLRLAQFTSAVLARCRTWRLNKRLPD